MQLNPDRYWWLIPASFLVAFLWQFWPLPTAWRLYTPDLLVMTTLYWALRRPRMVNSGWACVIGLIRDSIEGTPLGTHALALVIVSYIVQLLHQRLRLFLLWQQALTISALCLLYLLVGNWVSLLDPSRTNVPLLWHPALATGLAWPFWYLLLLLLEEGAWKAPIRS